MTPQSPVFVGSSVREVLIAKNQPPYLPLPAVVSADACGTVTTRWRLTWRERWRVLLRGDVWLQMLCFHEPVTPVKLSVWQPEIKEATHDP